MYLEDKDTCVTGKQLETSQMLIKREMKYELWPSCMMEYYTAVKRETITDTPNNMHGPHTELKKLETDEYTLITFI